MKTFLVTMVLLLLGRATSAQINHSVPPNANESFVFMTGNELLRSCQGKLLTYCIAFITVLLI
jgi:hypothetical protein